MPILYVHGVNVRSRAGFKEIEPYLRRLVAPAISAEPDAVLIEDVYWGDLGIKFAWEGASRPRSQLLGAGAKVNHPKPGQVITAAEFSKSLEDTSVWEQSRPSTGGLVGGAASSPSPTQKPIDLSTLDADCLSDLLATVISQLVSVPNQRTELILIADELVRSDATRQSLKNTDPDEQVQFLVRELRKKATSSAPVVAMGFGDRFSAVRDRISETVRRTAGLPTHVASVVLAETRKPLNDLVSVFVGDVFVYLERRIDKNGHPGEIPSRLISTLKRAHENKRARNNERLVVLSHSMGGQIVYDAITSYLPGDASLQEIEIDFWCATASQVGLFEEAKLFLASDGQYKKGNPVPYPGKHLGFWWNVWDHNDIISYTVKGIIDGVNDEAYNSGMSLVSAHSGYLQRPSFYRKFAEKLRSQVKETE